jgi:acetoin:2,6-dichlorophenolindophenol oxidoreductase subunit beta
VNGGQALELTMSAALNSAMHVAMELDDKVLLIGEDITDPVGGVFKVSKGLSTKFGTDRVLTTPIAEQGIAGAAIGAALGGYRPVAEIMFFDFTLVSADQLINHAAKLRYMSGGRTPVPITVRTTIGGGRFGAQHTQSLESLFMHIPGLKVAMPSNPADAKGLLLSCIFDEDPCLFIEHGGLLFTSKAPVPPGDYRVPLGKAAVSRAGTDVSVISYGAWVRECVAVADELAGEGIEAEVIDLRTLVPLDIECVVGSVARTSRALVVHGATRFCGPGAEIGSLITEALFGQLRAPVGRLGGAFTPMPFTPELEVLPTRADIATAIRALASS